jgi:hypothetical protein
MPIYSEDITVVLFQSTDNYDDTKLKQLWRYESFKKNR